MTDADLLARDEAIEALIADIVSCADELDGGKPDARAYAKQLVEVVNRKWEVQLRDLAAQLAAKSDEIRGYEHEHKMMRANLTRFVTDCSTPTFQLVRNALEQLAAVEQEAKTLREKLAELARNAE